MFIMKFFMDVKIRLTIPQMKLPEELKIRLTTPHAPLKIDLSKPPNRRTTFNILPMKTNCINPHTILRTPLATCFIPDHIAPQLPVNKAENTLIVP